MFDSKTMDVARGAAAESLEPRGGSGDALARLTRLGLVGSAAELARPVVAPTATSVDQAPLPVLPALTSLLPSLQRGTVLQVEAVGALVPALLAGASQAGSWCAVVGIPELGMAAAVSMGVDPSRTLLVDAPGERWDEVVSVLTDAVDVIVVRPVVQGGGAPAAGVVRRLSALARRRGAVLIVVGAWEGAGLRLRVVSSLWTGLGRGHGRLTGARVQVLAQGRGAAGRPRRAWLWLPGPDGRVAEADLQVSVAG